MNRRLQAVVDALVKTARGSMTAGEAKRFERELERICRVRPERDRRDLDREQLLQRHCPASLPPITLDSGRKALSSKRGRPKQHSWGQLRLPL